MIVVIPSILAFGFGAFVFYSVSAEVSGRNSSLYGNGLATNCISGCQSTNDMTGGFLSSSEPTMPQGITPQQQQHQQKEIFMEAGYPHRLVIGQSGTFTAKVFREINPPYTYEWDFGDGTKTVSQDTSHAYSKVGTYRVTVTAKDSLGNTASLTSIAIDVVLSKQ